MVRIINYLIAFGSRDFSGCNDLVRNKKNELYEIKPANPQENNARMNLSNYISDNIYSGLFDLPDVSDKEAYEHWFRHGLKCSMFSTIKDLRSSSDFVKFHQAIINPLKNTSDADVAFKTKIVSYFESHQFYQNHVNTTNQKLIGRDFLKCFSENIDRLIYRFNTGFHIENKLMPHLSECGCVNSSLAFDRTKNQRRQNIEKYLVNQIEKRFTDKSIQLHYLSLGCGGLLQDLIILNKLMIKGYCQFKISLVDEKTKPKALEQFKRMLELALPSSTIEINHYSNTHDYFKENVNLPIDIACALDFVCLLEKNALNAVISLQKCLSDDGILFYAYGDFELCFSQQKLIYAKDMDVRPKLLSVVSSIKENDRLNNKKQINYACLHAVSMMSEWVAVLPELGKHAQQVNISLTIPRDLMPEKGLLDQNSAQAAIKKNLVSLCKLLSGVPVNLIELPQLHKLIEFSPKTPFDIITCLHVIYTTKKPEQLKSIFEELSNTYPKAQKYFDIIIRQPSDNTSIETLICSGFWTRTDTDTATQPQRMNFNAKNNCPNITH